MYVDGFVLPVPTANREAYRKFAAEGAPLFKKHGALSFVECWGDDVPDGKVTSFALAVQKKDDETVVFSWITWPDKATRDKGMQAVMEETKDVMQSMPFDGRRMIYGGFVPIVEQ